MHISHGAHSAHLVLVLVLVVVVVVVQVQVQVAGGSGRWVFRSPDSRPDPPSRASRVGCGLQLQLQQAARREAGTIAHYELCPGWRAVSVAQPAVVSNYQLARFFLARRAARGRCRCASLSTASPPFF
jgi:hypothetical protein